MSTRGSFRNASKTSIVPRKVEVSVVCNRQTSMVRAADAGEMEPLPWPGLRRKRMEARNWIIYRPEISFAAPATSRIVRSTEIATAHAKTRDPTGYRRFSKRRADSATLWSYYRASRAPAVVFAWRDVSKSARILASWSGVVGFEMTLNSARSRQTRAGKSALGRVAGA